MSACVTSRDGGSALNLFRNCHSFSFIELPESSSTTYDDPLAKTVRLAANGNR